MSASTRLNASVVYVLTYSETVLESANSGTGWTLTGCGSPCLISFVFQRSPHADHSRLAEGGTFAFVVAPVTQSAFVAKLNSAGSVLTWSTYLGGNSYAIANGVATDGAGNAFDHRVYQQ